MHMRISAMLSHLRDLADLVADVVCGSKDMDLNRIQPRGVVHMEYSCGGPQFLHYAAGYIAVFCSTTALDASAGSV